MSPATNGPRSSSPQPLDASPRSRACQDSTFTAGLRVASYHRVSTVDQRPELARGELRAAAERLGQLVLEVEEVGSGARNDRPGWQRVMEAARRGQLDVVAVWKLDRAGRSTLDLLANIRQLQAYGIRFLAVTQGLDIRPGGEAVSQLLAGRCRGVRADHHQRADTHGSGRREAQGQAAGRQAGPVARAAGQGEGPARRGEELDRGGRDRGL